MPTLGKFVQRRRQELGLTQEQLAERIGEGIRQADVSRLENDHIVLPRRERLERLAEALDVPLGELLVRSGWAEADRALEAQPVPALTVLEPPDPPTVQEKLQQIETLVAEVRAALDAEDVDDGPAGEGTIAVDVR